MDNKDLSQYTDEELLEIAGIKPKAEIGEIMTPQTFKREQRLKVAPRTGQFIGGLGGGIMGGFVGHPYLGAIAGATLGRGIGKKIQEAFTPEEEKPWEFLKEMGKAAAVETALAPVGWGLTKTLSFLGRRILSSLLTPRVAERGFERGWRSILKPEYFKERVPQQIAKKTDQFFDKLTRTTGEQIEALLESPLYKKILVQVGNLKEEVKNLLPKGINVTDLSTSPVEQKLLTQATEGITKMRGGVRSLPTLWKQRVKLDKLINSRSWSEDAYNYMNRLRAVLNNPIRNAGKEIAEAFDKYHFVKEAEYDLGKTFMGIKGPKGEIYSPKLESFLANLLGTTKDEQIRRLKDLDALLNTNDKVINELLDYATAESLQKEVMGMGLFQRLLTGLAGGRKALARMGYIAQHPATQATKKIIGRTIPVLTTESLSQEENEQ